MPKYAKVHVVFQFFALSNYINTASVSTQYLLVDVTDWLIGVYHHFQHSGAICCLKIIV